MTLIITLSCRQTSVNAHCCPAPFSGDNSKKNGEASLEYGQLGASRPPACDVQSKAWMALPYRGIPSVCPVEGVDGPALPGYPICALAARMHGAFIKWLAAQHGTYVLFGEFGRIEAIGSAIRKGPREYGFAPVPGIRRWLRLDVLHKGRCSC